MIERDWAHQFADQWIAAFNSHDLERISSFYTDDFTMTSPSIRDRMEVASGTMKGKDEARLYWEKSLALQPPLLFVLKGVFVGIDTVVVHYESINRKLVCETFTFNSQGRITSASSQHGRAARQVV